MSKVNIPECWVCLDRGAVLYRDKEGYEFITHCICKAGNHWQYDGRMCKKPTKYYIPSVAERFDVHDLARQNIMTWWRSNRHKPETIKALKEQGVNIDSLTSSFKEAPKNEQAV